MMTRIALVAIVASVGGLVPLRASALSVMVYNIRHERLDSGEQSWEERRPRYMEMVADYRPHILAVQEASERQRRDVLEDNPRLAYSDPGHEHQNAVFYDRDRFAPLESGVVWISATPEVPESMDWDPVEPRTVYWVGLLDTQRDARVWVFNTHLDYRSARSREVGTELVYERLSDVDPVDHVLVVGDFNAHIGNEIFAPLWADPRDGDKLRIDFIIASRGLRPVEATVDRRQIDGLWPSDHFPVHAVLERTRALNSLGSTARKSAWTRLTARPIPASSHQG